jgi:Transcriptional regulators
MVPLVAAGCGNEAPLAPLPFVAVDNTAGAARATRYLLDLGHRTVHHVGGPGSWLDARERTRGWSQTLHEAGAQQPEVLAGDWSARSGYEIGLQLARRPEVTAVFCANDHMALGLLRALGEQGRRVPEDVSVVGFDDIPEAAFFRPPLTTVRQDFGSWAGGPCGCWWTPSATIIRRAHRCRSTRSSWFAPAPPGRAPDQRRH